MVRRDSDSEEENRVSINISDCGINNCFLQ